MNKAVKDVKLKCYPDEEEMLAAQLACCGRYCNACETPAEYAWRKREVDMSLLLEKAIQEELTETEKEIIIDYWFDSESLTQIAEKRKIKPPSVKGTLTRAQEKIERALRYAVFYQQEIMSESVVSAVMGRARIIASARNGLSEKSAERIKNLRLAQGLSMEKLEKATGIPVEKIKRLESGEAPEISELIIISDFFGVTTDYILKGEFNEQNII